MFNENRMGKGKESKILSPTMCQEPALNFTCLLSLNSWVTSAPGAKHRSSVTRQKFTRASDWQG